jgi:flagellar motor switch protein FliN/FliY
VHEEIEFKPLAPTPGGLDAAADLSRLHDVPVELAVEIGRTRMTIGQTLELRPGSVVSLNRLAGEPVDLLINGKPIAHGEVVVIDEEFGLRITDVVTAPRNFEDEAAMAAAEAAEAEAELLAHVHDVTSDEPVAMPPASDPFADASVDDLPLGGLPTPDQQP